MGRASSNDFRTAFAIISANFEVGSSLVSQSRIESTMVVVSMSSLWSMERMVVARLLCCVALSEIIKLGVMVGFVTVLDELFRLPFLHKNGEGLNTLTSTWCFLACVNACVRARVRMCVRVRSILPKHTGVYYSVLKVQTFTSHKLASHIKSQVSDLQIKSRVFPRNFKSSRKS